MSVVRMRFVSRWLGLLTLSVASGLFPSASRAQDTNEPPKELGLSYEDFDQRSGGGWRKIASGGKISGGGQTHRSLREGKRRAGRSGSG